MSSTVTGILAGGGPLPAAIADVLTAAGGQVFIIGFAGFVDVESISRWPHRIVALTAVGEILNLLRQENCRELVLIGPVKRPSLRQLTLDVEAARLMMRVGKAYFAGDDGLLGAVVRVLGEEGFAIRGAHECLARACGKDGPNAALSPDSVALDDINRGISVIEALGRLDIGQGCVVQNGLVLAVEAVEGTDAMLERVGPLKQPGPGGVLIKTLKPGQEARADMPTIGPRTIENAARAGLRGVAYQVHSTLIIDYPRCVALADKQGVFLYGISENEMRAALAISDRDQGVER